MVKHSFVSVSLLTTPAWVTISNIPPFDQGAVKARGNCVGDKEVAIGFQVSPDETCHGLQMASSYDFE